jgi:hypothetical protein
VGRDGTAVLTGESVLLSGIQFKRPSLFAAVAGRAATLQDGLRRTASPNVAVTPLWRALVSVALGVFMPSPLRPLQVVEPRRLGRVVRYTVMIKRTLNNQSWSYRNRIRPISAQGINLRRQPTTIGRADHATVVLFTTHPSAPWQCEIPLRPYGGPHWKDGYECTCPGAQGGLGGDAPMDEAHRPAGSTRSLV